MKLMKKLGLMLAILLLVGTAGTAGAATFNLVNDKDITLSSINDSGYWAFDLDGITDITSIKLEISATGVNIAFDSTGYSIDFVKVTTGSTEIGYLTIGQTVTGTWENFLDLENFNSVSTLVITVSLEDVVDGVTMTQAKLTVEGEKTADPQDPVPVPGSILLLTSGLTALLGFRRRLS